MLSENLIKLEKKNKVIYIIFLILRKIKETVCNWQFELFATLRKFGFSSKKTKKIKNYKNKHYGKRCFIIATGPSLTMEDVEKLKDEYTFSMNSMCLALDDTTWRPTYYGIQDLAVFEKLREKIKEIDFDEVLVGSNIAKKFDIPNRWTIFPLNISYHLFNLRYNRNNYFVKFSEDCHRAVYDGYTITYSLIQLAIYMGFKEIYLLGADNNYKSSKSQHFIEHGNFDPTFATAKDRMTVGYLKAKEYAEKRNVKIYNATRGGMLEVFPRVNLDEVV